jgi:hypothetical protein
LELTPNSDLVTNGVCRTLTVTKGWERHLSDKEGCYLRVKMALGSMLPKGERRGRAGEEDPISRRQDTRRGGRWGGVIIVWREVKIDDWTKKETGIGNGGRHPSFSSSSLRGGEHRGSGKGGGKQHR